MNLLPQPPSSGDMPGFERTNARLETLTTPRRERTVSVGARTWRKRWMKALTEKTQLESENAQLRQALDELNADVEQIMSDAAQVGHEKAKTWMIQAQRKTISTIRARLRELEA